VIGNTPAIFGGLANIGLCMVLFLLAKMVKDFTTSYSINKELTEKDNLAVAVSMLGYFLATLIVILGALAGPSKGLLADTLAVGGWGLFGIVLLNVSRVINDKFILRKFKNVKELVEDRNVGTGAVEFGSYIASGLVIAGSIHGEGGSVWTALAFFAASQVALVIFALIYELITPFNVHEEIERDNVAAGISFGGTLIALGVVLLNGTVGNFVSWGSNFLNFALYAVVGFILLPIVRFLFDRLIIPHADLNHEIKNDQNVGLGLLEMGIAVSFAVILFFSVDLEPLWTAVFKG